MWKKILIERDCAWTGVNGTDFDTQRYIGCIFYSMENVKNNTPYFFHGAYGATIGGAGCASLALSSINGCRKKGQSEVTKKMIYDLAKEMSDEILKDGSKYHFIPEPYPGE